MSVKYLYYTESSARGGYLSAAFAVPLLDQVLLMYGGDHICIHPRGATYPPTSAEQYETLADAQAAYPTHVWVYLDALASLYLDELVHPPDNVVYVVGHDLTGYGGETKSGLSYKLRVIPNEFEGQAVVTLATVSLDRWNRLEPWR